MRASDEQSAMPNGSSNEKGHPGPNLEAPPHVVLLNIDGLVARIGDLVGEAAATVKTKKLSPEVSQVLACPSFRNAFRELLWGKRTLIADPRFAAPYLGPKDGNPITFFFLNYRLHFEAGNYYQTDLQRDSPRLFNAIRNLLYSRYFKERLAEADSEILAAGFAPVIKGIRIKDMTDLSQLLPARRGIEPRVPDRNTVAPHRPVGQTNRTRKEFSVAAE